MLRATEMRIKYAKDNRYNVVVGYKYDNLKERTKERLASFSDYSKAIEEFTNSAIKAASFLDGIDGTEVITMYQKDSFDKITKLRELKVTGKSF